jgi:N,N'-diacetylchitobiose transport system substrate-binding protein
MRLRHLAAGASVAVVTALTASAFVGGASARPVARQADSITVWLQVDAQSSWPGVVDATNKAFQEKHPGVNVTVQYQAWPDHLTKLDAALAAGNAPDVVELGNTETAKYIASDALVNLSGVKSTFENSSSWVPGLAKSCVLAGKTYCVPYYAGARAMIYRKDLYSAVGMKTAPKTLDAFIAAGQKLMQKHASDPHFSAFYMPGQYWYAAMSFVEDYGGHIATLKGDTWAGTLSSPQAQAGLNKWLQIVKTLSRANKSGLEDTQDAVFAQGHVGALFGNGWEWGVITAKKGGNPKLAPKLGAFPLPSHTPGRFVPTFLGGSDLAVPATSKNVSLAEDWIRIFTSGATERQLAQQGKVIANSTTLANVNAGNPQLAPFAAAAKYSWFVPLSPNWANVENAKVLQNMLAAIATGRQSVAAATKSADQKITKILNAPS